MLSTLKLFVVLSLFVAGLQGIPVLAQQLPDLPSAPVPAQISSAKKIFISNAGEESQFRLPKDEWYGGGPNRAYNQFYAAMTSWGRYEIVSAPGDADLVFEIGITERREPQLTLSQLKFVVLDPKTHIALWTIFKYVEPAGMAKNREKNYDTTMTAFVDELKTLASAPARSSK